ncbi:MAG: hypothetical protein L6Q99_20050 [Planctomycetes bacterium]|nr:hypothetical protein [Planctomycetota bacterium]
MLHTLNGLPIAIFLSAVAPSAAARAPLADGLRVVGAEASLAGDARAAFERLNACADAAFRARRAADGSVARGIHGGALRTGAASPELAALEFLDAYAEVFGFARGLETTTRVRGETPLRVYVSFAKGGVPIEGFSAIVSFDAQSRIVAAEVRGGSATELGGSATELGGFERDASSAELAASKALGAHRARLGKLATFAGDPPRVWRVWLARDGGLVPAQRVEFVSARQGEAYSFYVDARSGELLRTVDRAYSGTGQYPFFGQTVPFSTGSAKCSTYKSMDAAIAGKAKSQKLKDWSLGIGAPVNLAKGFMTGARFDVFDDTGNDPFVANGKFVFDPLLQADAFDVANTGFEINAAYLHLKKNLGHELGSNFAMPLVVNVKDTTLNAFFTPSTFPDGHTDGFMVFFDNEQLGSVEADFSRDPSVVDHEYTHAWTHFEGESFEDPVDYPTRAANEAIADFFALAKQKDTVLARYIEHIYQGIGIARDLADDDHLLTTFADAVALTQSGLPEEHRLGEVFGCFMTDLRFELGTKKSMRLVYDALPFIANDMASIGFANVDANNAFDATQAFCNEFFTGMLAADEQAGGKNLGAIHGAAAARGIGDSEAAGAANIIDLASLPKGKLKIPSEFVVAGTDHVYAFTAPLNSKLTLSVKAKGGVQPEFDLILGTLTDFDLDVSANGEKLTIHATCTDANETYAFTLGTVGALGAYTLTLDI